MSLSLKVAKTELTGNSALAFQYLKDTYGTNIQIGKYTDRPLVIIGSLGAFQRMIDFANSEANNAMGDVERLAYQELKRKLLGGVDVYKNTAMDS